MRERLLLTVSRELERTHHGIVNHRPGGSADALRTLRFEASRLGRVVQLLRPKPRNSRADVHALLHTSLAPALAEAQRRGARVHVRMATSGLVMGGSPRLLEAFVVCVEDALSRSAKRIEVAVHPATRGLTCELDCDIGLSGDGLGMLVLTEVMEQTREACVVTLDRRSDTQSVVTMRMAVEPIEALAPMQRAHTRSEGFIRT